MNLESTCTIFTDGSSKGNPGPGGWAAVIAYDNGELKVKELGGRAMHTTNNRMEIQAAIEALFFVTSKLSNFKTSKLIIYTDSAYLLNGITKWVYGWQKNGWQTATKQPVENQDLWEQLFEITRGQKIDWQLVKGHVGVAGNHRCDEIATAFASGEPAVLYSGVLENYRIKNILDISADISEVARSREKKTKNRAKAFSYVSVLDGKVEVHQTWSECEKRVKGKSGVRFKKVFSKSEEVSLVKEWGS